MTGSATVMLEMFKQQAGVDIDIINYRGTAPALAATVNGETDFVIMPLRFHSSRTGAPRARCRIGPSHGGIAGSADNG